MKAFTVNKYGKGILQLTELVEPAVGEHDVLVQIHSAGVNLLDPLTRNGVFKFFLPYRIPFILGHDLAGVVTKVGSEVTKFKIGDEVYSRPRDFRIGTFAEYISVDENDVARKPNNLTMDEAGSIPLVGLTVWQVLVETVNLKKGQKIFIQAGSGGVGTIAIQLAKHLGAYVATTTSADNTDLVKRLGADLVINYKTEDFETKLKDYDVVLHSNRDPKILKKSLQVLKPGGHLVSLVGPPTLEFARQLSLPWYLKPVTIFLSYGVKRMARKLNVKFTFLFMRAEGGQLGEVAKLIEAGVIKPVIDKVFPFEQANEALAYVEMGRSKGKVVIKVR
ncbi:MAG TPA: NADP-dependent oxidoreductase [Candidatus Saccharimonadales bacterium]|nr:NADP-dependent oxidoreductase [Candidatus Saccharimonadales bacterium]